MLITTRFYNSGFLSTKLHVTTMSINIPFLDGILVHCTVLATNTLPAPIDTLGCSQRVALREYSNTEQQASTETQVQDPKNVTCYQATVPK